MNIETHERESLQNPYQWNFSEFHLDCFVFCLLYSQGLLVKTSTNRNADNQNDEPMGFSGGLEQQLNIVIWLVKLS